MIGYLKARSAERRARRVYELAVLQGLIDENRRRMEDLADLDVCKWCAGIELSAERERCASA